MWEKYGSYINRSLSILVAIYGVVEKDGDLILRSLAFYLVIIPCIWVPGKVNSLMAGRVYRGYIIDNKSPDILIQIFGWIILLAFSFSYYYTNFLKWLLAS
ncbi:MAG: hypothetical protein KUG64_08705 [Cycloclasticus sp.]|nr:hypothetical protein [Cycloclasticus sp.]